MVAIPRLVIAAPASGCGKTTVACGLMAALRARGLAVSAHKVGPDYIDPGYHALATGRPPRNLDPFLCGEDLIAPLFRHGAAGAQVAVIEGVMGLFDGVDPASRGDDPPIPPRSWGDPSPQTPLGGDPSPQTRLAPLAPLGGDYPSPQTPLALQTPLASQIPLTPQASLAPQIPRSGSMAARWGGRPVVRAIRRRRRPGRAARGRAG